MCKERGSAEEPKLGRPPTGRELGFINKKKLTGESRQERSSSIIIGC